MEQEVNTITSFVETERRVVCMNKIGLQANESNEYISSLLLLPAAQHTTNRTYGTNITPQHHSTPQFFLRNRMHFDSTNEIMFRRSN
jgi:hypothetical protein